MKSLLHYSIAFIFIALLACNAKTEKEKFFQTSFEETAPLTAWTNDQHCCEHSIQQSSEVFTDGKKSIRFEIRKTDPPTSRSIRAELVRNRKSPGDESWYGFNLYLQDWQNDNAGEHVFQWHPDNPSGIATAALWTSGGRFVFQTNTGGKNYYMDLGPVISNQWMAWVIHVKWENDESGLLQVWKNGDLVIDRKNIITSTREGNYFKLGINKFGWGIQPSSIEKRVLFFDDLKIGDETSGYDIVKPRINPN